MSSLVRIHSYLLSLNELLLVLYDFKYKFEVKS